MSLEPYVPISEYAAPKALMDAVEVVIDNNLVIAQNVLDYKNDAEADAAEVANLVSGVINPLLLGGA
jgi:hypothetical protein